MEEEFSCDQDRVFVAAYRAQLLALAEGFARQGFLIDVQTLHEIEDMHLYNSKETRKNYCAKVADLFDEYVALWAAKEMKPVGPFMFGRRGNFRTEPYLKRYGDLKRSHTHAIKFGFSYSDDDEEAIQSEHS